MKNIEEANTNPFPKNLPLKQSNTTTHFQKLFFSNNQTQQPKRNNEINKPKQTQDPPFCSHQIGLGFYWSCWDRIKTMRKVSLELIGSNRWLSLTLSCSISLVPHRNSPGFCSAQIVPRFVVVEFCWSLLKGKN